MTSYRSDVKLAAWSVTTSGCGLKTKSQASLQLPRSVDLCEEDLSEAGRGDACIWSCELDTVECIEELDAEVQAERLRQTNSARGQHVKVFRSRSTDIRQIAWRVAELEGRCRCEGGGIPVTFGRIAVLPPNELEKFGELIATGNPLS